MGHGSGPSVFVSEGGAAPGRRASVAAVAALPRRGPEELVWPDDLVLALATFAERERLAESELTLHLFPFGGIEPSLELTKQLAAGQWPSS